MNNWRHGVLVLVISTFLLFGSRAFAQNGCTVTPFDACSPNIGLQLPAFGAFVNTWNIPVNANMNLIDRLLSGNINLTGLSFSNGTISGNITFTGNLTLSGQNALTAYNLDNIIFVDGVKYATIQAAYNALPSTGGWIILPPGTYTIASTINIAKPVHIMGGGYTSPLSTSLAPTVVNCTGSGPAFSIATSNASQSVIEGFNLLNTGTCTIGIDLESNVDADVSGVTVRDMYIGSFSTAGVDIGGNTPVHLTINTRLENIYAANNGINFIVGLSADTTLDHVQALNYRTVDVQVGDSTHTAYRLNITDNSDLEPNNIPNATVVQVLNAESMKIDGDYFEQDGTGFAVDVPSTATKVVGLVISDCRFRSGGVSNNSAFAFRTALASANWTIIGNYFADYSASAGIIQNTAAASIAMFGNVTDSTVTNLYSAPGTGIVTESGNILNANNQVGPRFQSTAINPFIVEGPGPVQFLGSDIRFTNPLFVNIAPTIASGFGTSPSIVNSNGTAVFEVNVGTGGSATSGVLTMPTATTGWSCQVTDMNTNIVTRETAFTTASITFTAASAWTASDKLLINCGAF